MEPRISIITLGVDDMQRAYDFYCQLGFPTTRTAEDPIIFFQLQGTTLALFPRTALAKDVAPELTPANDGFSGITLAHNTREKHQVDEILETAQQAGGRIVKPAQIASWGGYSGYFSDPDGYLWEVAWAADWKFQADGSLVID